MVNVPRISDDEKTGCDLLDQHGFVLWDCDTDCPGPDQQPDAELDMLLAIPSGVCVL